MLDLKTSRAFDTDEDDDSLDDFFAREMETSWSEGGKVVAECIIAAAHFVENRLALNAQKVSDRLDYRGQKVIQNYSQKKSNVKSINEQKIRKRTLLNKAKGEVIVVSYTDKARRASEKLKQNTQTFATSIRGTATEALIMISEKADEANVTDTICPHPEGKEAFHATGEVALAALGAGATIYEALYTTTKTVASKSCEVSANVARHRYGENAGKAVENTGHAVGNTLRTVHLLAQINGENLAKTVARDTGKAKIQRKRSDSGTSVSVSSSPYSNPKFHRKSSDISARSAPSFPTGTPHTTGICTDSVSQRSVRRSSFSRSSSVSSKTDALERSKSSRSSSHRRSSSFSESGKKGIDYITSDTHSTPSKKSNIVTSPMLPPMTKRKNMSKSKSKSTIQLENDYVSFRSELRKSDRGNTGYHEINRFEV